MNLAKVQIEHHSFDNSLFDSFSTNHYAKDLWPLVYILSDNGTKTAYIGETTDAYSRMSTHLKHNKKSKLTTVHIITHDKFNKSATLDLESNLIKYMSGDNVYKLQNGNLGLANHNYYQKKEVYWDIFNSIWDQLRAEGITKHSIEHIDNSDLFKYSPYKSLTKEQSQGLYQILDSLANGKHKNTLVEGGAGTGKTILAIFLFKILSSNLDDFSFKEFGSEEKKFIDLVEKIKTTIPNPKMALVVPMSSFRTTLKKVFKNIKGLSASMVIGPAEVSRHNYDLVVVDESHRLRRRVNLGAYFGAFDKVCNALGLDKYSCSELDWVTMKSVHTVLFYDEGQSIKPSDAKKEDFDLLKQSNNTSILKLKSQFRVKGGNAYVEYIDSLLKTKLSINTKKFDSKEYEFILFDSLDKMVEKVKLRNSESGLSRLIAGYSWTWESNNKEDVFDIKIGDVQLKWNGTSKDWINSENSVNEVGCIHTTQGYDLNYSGIIFGNEISFNPETQEIIIKEENYFDKNGKQSIKSPDELKDFILNIYKTIMLRGIKGTYVYVCDENLRNYFKEHIPVFTSEKTKVPKTEILTYDKVKPYIDSVPLLNISAAAGDFSDLQNPSELGWLNLPEGTKVTKDYFACRVVGDSMNRVIPNGSYCLFKKDTGGSRQGRIVLVQQQNIQDSDFSAGYTVKTYHSDKTYNEDGWKHRLITLKPYSYNSDYEVLELKDEELNDFKIIGIFEKVLF